MAGSTFGSSTLSRRQLLVAGAASVGTLALFGCTWTPRNATSSSGTTSSSSQASASSTSATGSGASPTIDDGLVLVSGGTFTMGSPEGEPWRSDDEVAHEVAVSDFYLAPKEVSQLEYSELMGAGGGTGRARAPASASASLAAPRFARERWAEPHPVPLRAASRWWSTSHGVETHARSRTKSPRNWVWSPSSSYASIPTPPTTTRVSTRRSATRTARHARH